MSIASWTGRIVLVNRDATKFHIFHQPGVGTASIANDQVEGSSSEATIVLKAEDFNWISTYIDSVTASNNICSISQEDINIARRTAATANREKWLVPLECKCSGNSYWNCNRLGNIDSSTRIKVVELIGFPKQRLTLTAGIKSALIAATTRVPSRGKVGDAISNHLIDGLSDNPILKHRFCKVDNVIYNHICTCCRQIEDTLGKNRLTAKSRVESQISTWCHIMNQLHHGPSFINIGCRSGAILENVNSVYWGQVSASDIV